MERRISAPTRRDSAHSHNDAGLGDIMRSAGSQYKHPVYRHSSFEVIGIAMATFVYLDSSGR
jgi:hypothetical protein